MRSGAHIKETILYKEPKAATLIRVLIKAVTRLGDPWYTSGAQK